MSELEQATEEPEESELVETILSTLRGQIATEMKDGKDYSPSIQLYMDLTTPPYTGVATPIKQQDNYGPIFDGEDKNNWLEIEVEPPYKG